MVKWSPGWDGGEILYILLCFCRMAENVISTYKYFTSKILTSLCSGQGNLATVVQCMEGGRDMGSGEQLFGTYLSTGDGR